MEGEEEHVDWEKWRIDQENKRRAEEERLRAGWEKLRADWNRKLPNGPAPPKPLADRVVDRKPEAYPYSNPVLGCRSSGIYHYPSCKWRKLINWGRPFHSPDEAIEAGFRLCGYCGYHSPEAKIHKTHQRRLRDEERRLRGEETDWFNRFFQSIWRRLSGNG
jgi:hypothetical protein